MSILNQFKTVVLLGSLTGLLLWVGSLVGGMSGLTIALIFSLLMNVGAYWFSDKMVLKMYRAKEIKEGENPRLYKMVKSVAKKAGVPMPKVYIIPGEYSNAFATGRNPEHAAIACTNGILNLLNDKELEGVIAHEVAHIKNRDILISTIAATIAGVISYIAMMARFAAIFGGGRDRNGSGMELLVLAILTPILATLIQLAISRSREYVADATGARFLEDSRGLSGALDKLHQSVKRTPLRATGQTKTTAHMMIMNPFIGGALVSLFSTHPPHKERIKRLDAMKF